MYFVYFALLCVIRRAYLSRSEVVTRSGWSYIYKPKRADTESV